ncbi:DUF1000-domain-containing protein [Penicillium taxi]|uniref:DUF1000-domain-containing protein n=1 Tax=Penicillium taxi TaxID=168475 RepID=UPI00254542F3|nr:DUF1000-domain-containing protein [Penicillium taxi]KAJ5909100.1 DUF1000-domain-containing protein [Penicillium taxi]
MSDHHHDHGNGGHCHDEHDHSDDITPAIQSLLYSQITFDSITTLNASDRFAGQVNVHSLLIYTAPTPSAPRTLRLFKNKDGLDFSTASELTATQTIEVPRPVAGVDVFEIHLNRARWNATTSVTIFMEDNWSDGENEITKVGYIGFKGQFMALNRQPISFSYEAAANPSDHVAIPGVSSVGRAMPGQ